MIRFLLSLIFGEESLYSEPALRSIKGALKEAQTS